MITAEEKREIIDSVKREINEEFLLIQRAKTTSFSNEERTQFLNHAINFMAGVRHVDVSYLMNGTQKGFAVKVRHEFYYIVKRIVQDLITNSDIGEFTKKDKATVIHGIKTIQDHIDISADYRETIHDILVELKKRIPEELQKFTK